MADQQDLDQHEGEEDRERIVDAGFDLEGCAHTRPQPQPAGMQQEKDRRGVGRGDDRAHQQRLRPTQAERPHRRRRGERGGHQHPDCRPAAGRPDHIAERLEPGAQATVEKNEAECHRPDRVGELDIVEPDAEWPGFAGQHAHDQERQQQWRPEPHCKQAREDAGQHQQRAEQNADTDRIEQHHRATTLLDEGCYTGAARKRQQRCRNHKHGHDNVLRHLSHRLGGVRARNAAMRARSWYRRRSRRTVFRGHCDCAPLRARVS